MEDGGRRRNGNGTCSVANRGIGLIIISVVAHRAPEDKAPHHHVDDSVSKYKSTQVSKVEWTRESRCHIPPVQDGRKWEFHAPMSHDNMLCSHLPSTFHFARPSPLMRHSLASEGIAAATPVAAGDDSGSGSGSTVSSSKQQLQADSGQG